MAFSMCSGHVSSSDSNAKRIRLLSDTDENSDAEIRLKERMNADGVPPPKQDVLAPASLYLTAIIESICEHILSNVGRVASRDSSRATANSQDLFIALCEDSIIYDFFKNIKVYGQIEALSKPPKPRRSKSREKLSGAVSPASSREGDAFRKDSSYLRKSSESSSTGPAVLMGSLDHPSTRHDRLKYLVATAVEDQMTIPMEPTPLLGIGKPNH